ncbi:MAG TPA: hypothetical protein VGE52_03635, partial [Pirellulales bacterium]
MRIQSLRRAAFPLLAGLAAGALLPAIFAQDVAQLDRTQREQLKTIFSATAAAMQAEDAAGVRREVERGIDVLGDQAGLPEAPDEFRPLARDAAPLSATELPTAFDPYIQYIERRRWWKIGLDPTTTNHALREIATIVEGCLAARAVCPQHADKLLAVATEAGDFLVWTQEQAGTGVYPFPAVRNGKGRPFEVAEAFYRRAEIQGKLDQVVKHGWTVEDFNDGGLQFDNGLAGVALIHLAEATRDEKYKRSALKSADWAMRRPVVTNWNYNSFSVLLLAHAFRVSGDERYLAAAKKKALLGVIPGQLTAGPRMGRWADPHNARPAYHYIMIRGLASLAAVLPESDADLPQVVAALRLALRARNPDFETGIV